MFQTSTETDRIKSLARSAMYKLLAKSFLHPCQETFDFIQSPQYEECLAEYLSSHEVSEDLQSAIRSLHATESIWRSTQTREHLEKEYTRLFAHLGSAKCPPYETEYGHDNVFQKTEAMADIAGFYNAYGLDVSTVNADRVDFLSMELEFMSYLSLHEAYALEHEEKDHLAICVDTQQKFLRDHLARWVTIFSQILAKSTVNPFYRQLAIVTEQFLDAEVIRLGVTLEKVAAPNKRDAGSPAPFGCNDCVTTP